MQHLLVHPGIYLSCFAYDGLKTKADRSIEACINS
jgi:hypothetical protein